MSSQAIGQRFRVIRGGCWQCLPDCRSRLADALRFFQVAYNIGYTKVHPANASKRQQMADTAKYDADHGSVCFFCSATATKKIRGMNICDDQFCRYQAWVVPSSHEDEDTQTQEGPQR